ncbi:MAG TPA: hypothetical protein DEA58_00045 [Pseudothermotoga sp.]|nr:MAG: Peptidase C11 clostripain [Pseudothermotoga lettingae]HBT25072.1 hypothetical protein [Pseudothermotoga sp.]
MVKTQIGGVDVQKKIFSMLVLFSLILFASSCVSVFNNPPNAPANPYPEDNATDVSPDLSLQWSCSDPDGDILTYDIYFGTDSNNLQLVEQNYSSNSYQISDLEYNKKYYWKIVAKDTKNAIKEGPIWSFTTVDINKCKITVSQKTITIGRVGYVEAKVLSSTDKPVENIDITFEYYDGTWKQLSTVKTNSNGIASQELSYDFRTQEGELLFRAYIKDQPAISAQENINFQKPSWVFLIYLAADNNLEQYALVDLEEMKNTNSKISVFTLLDGKDVEDALLTLDEYGEYKYIETYQQDINSGDPEVLKNFIERFSNITSAYRGLIIWNHGSAWLGDSDYTTKAIGFDDTQNTALAVSEIRQVLEKFEKFNILGMDACLMGSIEVAYELKDCAEYFIASFFSEPSSGWDYSFLSEIDGDSLTAGQLIVDKYFNSLPDSTPLSLCVYDMSHLSDLADKISNIGSELKDALQSDSSLRTRILYYRNSSTKAGSYPYNLLIDMGDFASQVKENEIQITTASEVLSSLDNTVVYKKIKGAAETTYGVSIFFPEKQNDLKSFTDDLNTLLFYTDTTGWIDFLNEFVR